MPDVAAEQHVRPIPQFATTGVLLVAALTAIAHCGAAVLSGGYWFDEVYMLAIGRYHLDWGSADQPPVAPALAAVLDAVAPGSPFALRLPAVLATAGAVVLAGLIAREFGGERRAQLLTAAAQATMLWTTLAGHWLTPYTLETVQWLVIIWLLLRWMRLRDDRLLLAIGVTVGIAAMTKFQVVLLCVALLVCAAVLGPRELLRRPLLWAGALIAAVMTAPTVLWQHAHGWPQLQMTAIVAGEADALYGGRPGIAVQLILYAGVLGVALGAYGAWKLLRLEQLREYRFLLAAGALLYLLFVLAPGRPYYLAGLYAPFAAAGAYGLQRRREQGARSRRWPLWSAVLLAVASAVAVLTVSVQITRSDIGEQIARDTAAAYRELPDDRRERTAVMGQSYIVAAYLDGYAPRYGLPAAYSLNRSYGYFDAPPDSIDSVLYVGPQPDALRPYFTGVRTLDAIGDDMHIYLLTGRQQPWQSIWAQRRTLTVS
ncbi:glycosyltransferase family 39 protein [Mycobacterium sp. 21AC1]|uniref:ArnT family glycosyltransferase n=1 Tax=[Mycobacterium] appelbergii TaxID=2939269 RepID=UPI0029390A31|nr:glycosyltransferase family 39 protein [Mycobacterium sp. 21AC1]MDV3126346.1 glycosyltransferase family 39 protein [Mycobacterium sp. 21AC1]